jgi:hypothetical protein
MQQQRSRFKRNSTPWRKKVRQARRIGIWLTAFFDSHKGFSSIMQMKRNAGSRMQGQLGLSSSVVFEL